MKIIYLSTARLPDEWAHGLQIMQMCSAFAAEGAHVQLVVPLRAGTVSADPFKYYGVKKNFSLKKLPCIDFFPGTQSKFFFFLRNFSFLISARTYLFFTYYDLLYTREHSFLPYFPAQKTVLELHSIPAHVGFWRQAKRLMFIVTISQGIKDDVLVHGVSASSVLIAPDAVDLEAFENPEPQAAARNRLGLPLDKKIALYIGRLDQWKGVETLFEAAKLVPDVQIVVIGGERGEIESFKKQYPAVIFLGPRPFTELADNQAAGDVLILPNTAKNTLSAKYTSPLKLFTYMASDKPVVASDLPSIREILDEGMAVLVKPDDPQALADGVKKVLADPTLGARLAKAARQKVENYSWHNRAKTILDFIKNN